jgi:hypothetical protein
MRMGYAYNPFSLCKTIKKAKRGRNTHGFVYVSVCARTRRCIKTQLEVPDNRLCNCCNASVTLCNSDNVDIFARQGKV